MSRTVPASYRIGAIAKLTGLSAHTIRVWERRYGAVEPVRTPGGTREYSAQDLEKLTLLRALSEAGHSIGRIATLETVELDELVRELQARKPGRVSTSDNAPAVETLLAHIMDLDVASAERALLNAAAVLAPLAMIFDVVAPLVEEVETRREFGEYRIAHEHAATTALRTLLRHLLSIHTQRPMQEVALTATMSGERHELGALMASFIAVTRGYNVLYMGPDLPVEDIVYVVEKKNAKLLLLSMENEYSKEADEQLAELLAQMPVTVRMVAGGREHLSYSHRLPPEKRVSSLRELHRRLAPKNTMRATAK